MTPPQTDPQYSEESTDESGFIWGEDSCPDTDSPETGPLPEWVPDGPPTASDTLPSDLQCELPEDITPNTKLADLVQFTSNRLKTLREGGITTIEDLQWALLKGEPRVYDALNGQSRTRIALALDWEEICKSWRREQERGPNLVPLELAVNSLPAKTKSMTDLTILSGIAPQGVVVTLGDWMSYTHTPRGVRSTSRDRVDRIDSLGFNKLLSFHNSKQPAGPTLLRGSSSFAIHSRTPLTPLRDRYQQTGTEASPDVPLRYNGWTRHIRTTQERIGRPDEYPTGYTRIEYVNDDHSAKVFAKWHPVLSAWEVHYPRPLLADMRNCGKANIEPQVGLATAGQVMEVLKWAMDTIDATAFQCRYRQPATVNPDTGYIERAAAAPDIPTYTENQHPAPCPLPTRVGDWELGSRSTSDCWINEQSFNAWHEGLVTLNMSGAVSVSVPTGDTWGDGQLRRTNADGAVFANFGRRRRSDDAPLDYRSRDAFEPALYEALAFMVQTSLDTDAAREDVTAVVPELMLPEEPLTEYDCQLDLHR